MDMLKYIYNCIFDYFFVYFRNGSLIVDFWFSVVWFVDVVIWRNVIKDVLEKNGSIYLFIVDLSYFVYDLGNYIMFIVYIFFCYKGCKI